MQIFDSSSLVKTIDNINEYFLFGKEIPQPVGLEAARWITSRQGEKGAYRGMFAPTPLDFEQGIHVFTGENLTSASARHIMGEEAARAVWLLGRHDPEVKQAYDRAVAWMFASEDSFKDGTFCCGRCTLAFWRHYWVGDFPAKEELITKGLRWLKEHRLGDGKWRRFPFFYTIYTLLELEVQPAKAELRYARPAMDRVIKSARSGVYSQRRQTIIQKVLAYI